MLHTGAFEMVLHCHLAVDLELVQTDLLVVTYKL